MRAGFPKEASRMSMKIRFRQANGVTIVDCMGRIDHSVGTVVLRDAVREALSNGQTKILLNLGEVDYIDSSGIAELVGAFMAVRREGGALKLLNLSEKVHDVFQVTRLYTVFDVRDNEAGAIKSFNADAAANAA
jgi:anti-sigma B factor antagonist